MSTSSQTETQKWLHTKRIEQTSVVCNEKKQKTDLLSLIYVANK